MTNNRISPSDEPTQGSTSPTTTNKVSTADMFRYADFTSMALVVVGSIMSIANGVVMPLFSVILGGLFDDLNSFDALNSSATEVTSMYANYFMYLGVGMFILGAIQVGFFTFASERISMRVREAYFSAVLRQDISWFDMNNSAELTTTVSENSILMREALSEKFGAMLQNLGTFVGGFAIGFYQNWELTLVICCCAPLLAISGAFVTKLMEEATSEGLKTYASAGGIVEESLSMIRTVANLGIEKRLVKKYVGELEHAEKAGIKKGFFSGFGMGVTMLVMFSAYGLSFWYGSTLVARSRITMADTYAPNTTLNSACVVDSTCADAFEMIGVENSPQNFTFSSNADICFCVACQCGCTDRSDCVTGGDVLLVFFSVLMGAFAIGQATPGITALSNGRVAAAVIYKVIDQKRAIDSGRVGKELDASYDGTITFEDVCFSYPTRPEIKTLDNFSLTIESMKSCALVGGSGSGKSTIVSLIERFYDPDSGNVKLAGTNLRELDVKWLRNQIGLVGQEPVLFACSIFQNIAYGLNGGNGVTMEMVVEAAKMANAHDFIMGFPNGYNTGVGEKGSQLSGGQKQRIAIARSIIRNPKILLLDEATSALDNESERIVQKALDDLLAKQKRTTVVIAHRLSTIRDADTIVVMEKGVIVEKGNHETLLGKGGHYAALVAASERKKSPEAAAAEDTEAIGAEESDRLPSQQLAQEILVKQPSGGSGKVKSATIVPVGGKDSVAVGKKNPPSASVPIRRLREFQGSETKYYIPGCIAAAILGAQMPAFSVVFSNLLSAFYVPTIAELESQATIYAILFVGIGVAVGVSSVVEKYYFSIIGEKMTSRLRTCLFKSLLYQDVGFFDMPENSVGALTSALATDAALVKASLADRMSLIVMNVVTVVLGLGVGFYYGWLLTLILLLLMPVMAVGGALQMVAMSGFASSDTDALAQSSQVLTESIMGVRTVAAFDLHGPIVNLYRGLLHGPAMLARKKGIIGGAGFGFSQFVMFAVYGLSFYIGGFLIDGYGYTFQQLTSVFFGVVMAGMGLGQASAMAPDVAKAGAAAKNVFKVVDRVSRVDASKETGASLAKVNGELDFQGIRFAYPTRPDAPVFSNFTLNVPMGTSVALVGSSGSGKSTVVQLLERFYDPDQGSVKLDGADVTGLNIAQYRRHIGLVSQEPRLFRGTIAENIGYGLGEADATIEQIHEAAKAANAHDFILGFPNGYDTDVGDAGTQLSGGQKQRIAIARAIIRDPSIMILDEATSALDNESERIVQEALDRLMALKKRTTVIVAHRLSTIRDADKIVVVHQGKIVEQGTHDFLLANGSYYPKLYNVQQQRE